MGRPDETWVKSRAKNLACRQGGMGSTFWCVEVIQAGLDMYFICPSGDVLVELAGLRVLGQRAKRVKNGGSDREVE